MHACMHAWTRSLHLLSQPMAFGNSGEEYTISRVSTRHQDAAEAMQMQAALICTHQPQHITSLTTYSQLF
jgi:hypothetical protein